MNEIIWLGDPSCDDPSVVGGKAANLGRLMATHPVPLGFCLTAAAHSHWADGPLEPLPEAFTQLVTEAYAMLGARTGTVDPIVAVRSSAVDEDGALASFAGVYITCLNVRGAAKVLEAIRRCWDSARDPRVAAYRERQGLSAAGLGVLVQELVSADSSAVVFSKNPTTGATEELVINANYGLGESIVGGLATPDTWIVRKADLSPLRFQLGPKEKMTVVSAEGTREIAVLRTLRERPSLTPAQVQELAQLALRLEATMGWPVDIECAYRGTRLYLLQCRAITTG
jgi:pyruvate,water dikinase